ncbi:MAG TPA: hypothetical protein DCE78_11185 [Bacteroidetes bacterium]|nr:hypothetical protein [Bacteroidota bacterium]
MFNYQLSQIMKKRQAKSKFEANSKPENNSFAVEIRPIVIELTGVISLPKNFDYKKERLKYLEEKYK